MNGVYKVSLGESHGLMIKNGDLYSWGFNTFGQLGLGNPGITYQEKPKLISNSGNWTDVSAGTDHSLGICGGYLYSWGSNYHGQLGLTYCDDYWAKGTLKNYGHSALGKPISNEYSPRKIGGMSGWSKISAGKQISFAIKNGFLYGWGRATDGIYVDQTFGFDFSSATDTIDYATLVVIIPIRISKYTGWTDISTKSNFTLGICGGNLLGWNNCSRGVLGNGVSDTFKNVITKFYNSAGVTNYILDETGFFNNLINEPAGLVGFPTNKTWESVSAGSYHSLGISGGDLYGWGGNTDGALGDGTTFDRAIPVLVDQKTTSQRWKKVSAGLNYSLGLSELIGLDVYLPYSWGTNLNAQLGDGTTNRSLIPAPLGIETYQDLSAGPYGGAAIESFTDTYKLYTWGWDPLKISPSAPNILSNPNDKIPNKYKTPNTNIKKISVGWNDIYILDKFGNLDYIPVDGTVKIEPSALAEFNYTTVGDIKIYSRITDVAAGFNTAIVAKADNTISIDARGYNSRVPVAKPYYSQPPELENIPQRAWKKLTTQTPISGVYCGVSDYGIIFDDGTGEVDVWGKYRQSSHHQPLPIKWKQVVSGGNHIVILTKYNTIYCFGDNTHGQCNVPSGLTGVESVFATSTASGAILHNGDVVYWGNYDHFDGLDQLGLYSVSNNASYKNTTVALPLNRKYKHNLIGYTFDGTWGEELYKQEIKNKLQEYYTQRGTYPKKLILNIQDKSINPLRWFNEPATIKYLGFTLNSAGISSANDGITYQNLLSNNFSVAPTRYEDFNKVLQSITQFYNLGYTLAKQAIYEISGDKNTIAVGFNTGQLLPDYTFLGFSASNGGYTLNYKNSWATGNTLLNYKEYTNDTEWTPYVIQGPDSYLPVSGFDTTNKIYKPYSGTTATNNYYVNSTGVTAAVYTTYYNRWKEFLAAVNFDFVVDNNISKFILPEEISNTPVIWTKTKQIFKDYETANNLKLNKNLLTSFSNYTDTNIGVTLDVINNGPVLVQGATGISVNIKQFIDSITTSKTTTYDYNTSINNLKVFDNSILAILGNTFERKALDQWYYYGIVGGTYSWQYKDNDPGYTSINWSVLQTELINENYSVFTSSKPNTNKLVNLFNYFKNLNQVPNQQFNFYNITDIVKIKSGKDHSILLNRYGKLNFLGATSDNRQNIPDGKYIDISAGDLHSAAIDETGSLFTTGKIVINSGACSGSTLTVDLTPISGSFDTVESGGNHLALFETGDNKKYYGTVESVDDVFKRIYVKNYSAADESVISFDDPSGTSVSIIRDGSLLKTIQHKLLSIDSYINTVQNVINGSGVVQDISANNGAAWKTYFINSYKNAENNPYLITPVKIQQETIKVSEIKYLNNNVLYEFQTKFKELVKTENIIDIKISDL